MTSGWRRALVVRGGCDGNRPVQTTNLFLPFLREHGFDVLVEDSLEVYEDEDLLHGTDLVLQCWSGGDITRGESAGLLAAVRAGTGFAGWHRGVVDAFREDPDYQLMTGGTYAGDPSVGGLLRVRLCAAHADHPVLAGLGGLDGFTVDTDGCWTLTDPLNDVLATVTYDPDDTRRRAVTVPAVWTRTWGKGRVFVSTVGRVPADFGNPHVRTLTRQGLLWASR